MPRKETYSGPLSAQAQQDLVSEGIENFELPKSVVMKIAKSAIPDNVKLQKETVLSLVKGSTVFINYLAATAHDVAQSKQHKSISASDVLKALETIEFSDMVNKLQGELILHRDLSKNDKGRKGNSSTVSGLTKKVASGHGSISAPLRAKGKEKLSTGNPMPIPFTSAPLGTHAPQPVPMDIDEEMPASASAIGRVDPLDAENWEGASDGAEETFDETEGDEEGFEVPDDSVALEEAETRADERGLEHRTSIMDDGDD